MKIASLQGNYLPWTGVFELINSVDNDGTGTGLNIELIKKISSSIDRKSVV